jgi:hypothetical protein
VIKSKPDGLSCLDGVSNLYLSLRRFLTDHLIGLVGARERENYLASDMLYHFHVFRCLLLTPIYAYDLNVFLTESLFATYEYYCDMILLLNLEASGQ